MMAARVDLAAAWRAFTAELAAELAPLELAVTDDPQTLNPPCVLVGPATPSRTRLGGWSCVTLEVPVYVVAPGPPDANAVGWLLEQVPAVADVLGVPGMTFATYDAKWPTYTATARLTVTAEPEPAPAPAPTLTEGAPQWP